MKNYAKTLLIAGVAFVIGLGVNNFAMSDVPSSYKIAVVDVNKVVAGSSQVKNLQKEQQKKVQDLQKWLTTVKADVEKQKTKEAKEKLVKKYDAEFAKKQETIKKDYATKLQAIDKNISSAITQQAKAQNYNLVLAKGTVLYGGEDITAAVQKAIK